MFKPTL